MRPFRNASPVASYIAGSPDASRRTASGAERSKEHGRCCVGSSPRPTNEASPSSYALTRLHICELELRAGDWNAAERLLDDWALSAERELLLWPMYERCRALHAMGRGLPDEARRWAAEASERAQATGVAGTRLEALRALGTTELLVREPAQAVEPLRRVWEHGVRGRPRSGCVRRPELVEALLELGEPADASAVTARVRELAELQSHPWGAATALRCTRR